MKKFVKYLFIAPTTFLTIIPAVGCSCSQEEDTKEYIPESKMIIKNGVLSGFVDGFEPRVYKSLIIPEKVTTISASAFSGIFVGSECQLKTIKIPSSVKTIETKAFYGCRAISKYDLSSFSTTEGYDWSSDAFSESSESGTIIYPESNNDTLNNQIDYLLCDAGLNIGWFDSTKERSVDNKYLNIDSDNILNGFTDDYLKTPHTALYTKIIIPANVILIKANAFYNATEQTSKLRNITTVNFTNAELETEYVNLQAIGESAFRASNITKINLKPGILSLGKNSFQDCKALTEVTLPYTLLTISEGAFKGCSEITEITIPSTTQTVSNDAFKDCSKLCLINVEQFNAPPSTWSTTAFLNIAKTGKVVCKPSYAQEWKSYFINSGLDNWTYTDKIDILNGYESIVQPYPLEDSWTVSEISSHYNNSLDANIQILVDDLYHSFYEWTKTVNTELIEITSFEMLIKNASINTEYKMVSFNVYYDITWNVKGTNEPTKINAKGSWSINNLPFEIQTAQNVSTEGENPRKFVKLVADKLETSRRWFLIVNEIYKVNDGEPVSITDQEIYNDSLASLTEYPVDKVGTFMNLNKFLDYRDSKWTWGLLSSYLQNITVKTE